MNTTFTNTEKAKQEKSEAIENNTNMKFVESGGKFVNRIGYIGKGPSEYK